MKGGGETVNGQGIEMLVAFKRLAATDWILAAQMPTAEAYHSINTGEKIAWGIAIGALFTLALAIVLASSRLFAPLQSLTKQVQAIGRDAMTTEVSVKSDDEIGELAGAFNDLLRQLKARERETAAVANCTRLSQIFPRIGFSGAQPVARCCMCRPLPQG